MAPKIGSYAAIGKRVISPPIIGRHEAVLLSCVDFENIDESDVGK